MAIPRPMMLGDEPVNTPPPVLDDNDSIFSTPRAARVAPETRTFASEADPIETRVYTPEAIAPTAIDTDGDGIADEGVFSTTPTYADRRSSGSGRKIAMVAIPVLAVAIAGGLFLTSTGG